MTCQSLMILLKVPAQDLNWTNWKKVAAKPQDLIKQIRELDKDNVKIDTIKTVKTLLSKEPDYSPDLLVPKSLAAKNIAVYVHSIMKYFEISQIIRKAKGETATPS